MAPRGTTDTFPDDAVADPVRLLSVAALVPSDSVAAVISTLNKIQYPRPEFSEIAPELLPDAPRVLMPTSALKNVE